MQFGRILLIYLLTTTLLIGCSAEKKIIRLSTLHNIRNQFSPFIVWHQSIGNGSGKHYSKLSPVYSDSVVYAADRKGTVKAMNVYSGSILWSIDLSQEINFFKTNLPALLFSGLTISSDKLYIGTETGKVIALSKINGKIAWEKDVSGEALSKPVIANNLLLIHTNNGIIQALDAQTGHSKWSTDLGNSLLSIRGKSAPAIDHNVAIVGSYGGRISAIMLTQGEILWQQYISQIHGLTEIDRLHDVNMTPVIDIKSGDIFAVAYNGDLVAMDMRSGKIIWKRNLGSVNDIIIVNNIIYLVDQNDRVFAINKSDGVTLWTQDDLLNRNLTAPAICGNYLVVGDKYGYLYWLDIQDGKFIVKNKINSSGIQIKPIIFNNKLLIQAKDGTVYLISH
ncbi:MAG: outer membrane protein assembly factor BamB [Arsenophonus sp.]